MNKEEVKEGIAHLKWLLDNGILTREDEPHFETVLNYIEELEHKYNKALNDLVHSEKEKQQVLDDYQELGKDLHNNFIPKQVILDKIEEIKNIKLCGGKVTQAVAEEKIQVLQEILKGEEQ